MSSSYVCRSAATAAWTTYALRIITTPSILHRQIPKGTGVFGGGIVGQSCYAWLCLPGE